MTKLVYVMAASHSGSTLLSMLFNVHPDVVTAGEVKAGHLGDPSKYRCSCHAFIQSCPFWAQVNEEMRRRGHDFAIWDAQTHWDAIQTDYVKKFTGPLVRGASFEWLRDRVLGMSPAWRKGKARFLQRSVDLVESIAKVAGARVVVESSKVALRLRYLAERSELEVHVVRLIRDGRAVALTYMQPNEFADAKDAKLRGGGGGGYTHVELDMRAAAHEWRRSNEEAELLLSQIKAASVTELSYEGFCAEPVTALNQVFSNLELSSVECIGDFKAVTHHVIGNGMRLDTNGVIELDERWRQTLTEEDLTTFDEVAGDLNRRYGYR